MDATVVPPMEAEDTKMPVSQPLDPTDVKIRLERLTTLLDSVDQLYLGEKETSQAETKQHVPVRAVGRSTKPIFMTEISRRMNPRATSTSAPQGVPMTTGMKSVIGGVPITYQTARDVRQLISGSSLHPLSSDWMCAGFIFQQIDGPFPYGLLAERKGTRGLLMSVQAFILKHLIFKFKSKEEIRKQNVLQPSTKDRREALISALCDIIWEAGEQTKAVVCLPQNINHFGKTSEYNPDGFSEKLNLFHFTDFDELRQFIKRYLSYFEYGTTSGCVLFLYSVVLSRTIERLYKDQGSTDVQLLTNMEECTQSLLTLLLSGRAVCYLHNGQIIYDNEREALEEPLCGISSRCQVGHLCWNKEDNEKQKIEVGSMLRTPRRPIWTTLLNTHHYGVLFGLNPELVGNWRAENRFDLYYYTGLSNQTAPARLSVDTRYGRSIKGRTSALRRKEVEKIPTLERCIMSKYPGAEITWNGVHPFI